MKDHRSGVFYLCRDGVLQSGVWYLERVSLLILRKEGDTVGTFDVSLNEQRIGARGSIFVL